MKTKLKVLGWQGFFLNKILQMLKSKFFVSRDKFSRIAQIFYSRNLQMLSIIETFVLVITYLREKFGINLPSSLFWNSKFQKMNEVNFPQISRIKMRFLVNHMLQAFKEHTRVRIIQKTININKFNKHDSITPTLQ